MSPVYNTKLRRDTDQSITEYILNAISDEIGTPPMEFSEVLYDAVDPDALDSLLEPREHEVSIEFTYLGYRIVVSSSGDVRLHEVNE